MKILGNSVNLTKGAPPPRQGREAAAAPAWWGFLVPKNFLKRENTAKVPLKLK